MSRHYIVIMELRGLIFSKDVAKITPSDVDRIYHRHGVFGSVRKELADHLSKALRSETIKSEGGALVEQLAIGLDRLCKLLHTGTQ